MLAGVLMCLAGLIRYRRAREQIDSGNFQPAGYLNDLVGIGTALFDVNLAAYFVNTELHF